MGGRSGSLAALALVVALGGCQLVLGIEDYPDTLGKPCSGNEVCGTGQACDFTVASGAVCIAAEGDEDDDGIPDTDDHCLHMAGGEFDEDGDGMGDECDRCPIARPPMLPDTDGDGVDAPCDPDPGTPGEKIVFFDGFNGIQLGAAWRPDVASAWHVAGGALRYDGSKSAPESVIKLSFSSSLSVAVQTAYHVERIETISGTHRVAIAVRDPAPTAGVARMACSTERIPGYDDRVAVESSGGFDSTVPNVDLFSPVYRQRVTGYRNSSNASCVFIAGNAAVATLQTAIGAGALAEASLTAQGVSVSFESVVVVSR